MDTAKTDTPAKESTFTVGELITPANLEATFRILSVGTNGLRIQRISPKVIVPKSPFLVRFKGVLFKVAGWSSSNPRYFSIHIVKEAAITENNSNE
jgi:hypothetical protein